MAIEVIFEKLGLNIKDYYGEDLEVRSPVNGKILASLAGDTKQSVESRIKMSHQAFLRWRLIPAPKRGELIRLFGNILRDNKETLAELVTWECGKILEEARGEVQEMIDVCDFAVGLSRQLHGLTIASERYEHVMQENWHPLGVVGIISAFNFPVAVWAWNAALAIVCGDSIIWKPSEKTPLTAIACHGLFNIVCQDFDGEVPDGLSSVLLGDAAIGEQLVKDSRVALISATGSCRMGQHVGVEVVKRYGKVLLELGGNNAVIVTPSADLNVAIPSILFGAVGTAGQRCTTTRRLFVHRDIYSDVLSALKRGYQSIIDNKKIGNPFVDDVLIGPLIDAASWDVMERAIVQAEDEDGKVLAGGKRISEIDGVYVEPTLIAMPGQSAIVEQETFAPILYVMEYSSLEDVMVLHNAVEQGLSSAIFTHDIREAEYFKRESDCGIANVNIGTSGAEIGGAFGGEKATGGGRESGSDSWKFYMRRQTSTSYYGYDTPVLAQGISFSVE